MFDYISKVWNRSQRPQCWLEFWGYTGRQTSQNVAFMALFHKYALEWHWPDTAEVQIFRPLKHLMYLDTVIILDRSVPQRLLCWKFGTQCSNAQRWTFGKWLDNEGFDLINELIHRWIHNLMAYWEVVETIGSRPELKGESLGAYPWELCLVGGCFLSLLASYYQVSSFVFSYPSTMMYCITSTMVYCSPQAQKPQSQLTMNLNL